MFVIRDGVLVVGICSFPVSCLGQTSEFSYIFSFHLLFFLVDRPLQVTNTRHIMLQHKPEYEMDKLLIFPPREVVCPHENQLNYQEDKTCDIAS